MSAFAVGLRAFAKPCHPIGKVGLGAAVASVLDHSIGGCAQQIPWLLTVFGLLLRGCRQSGGPAAWARGGAQAEFDAWAVLALVVVDREAEDDGCGHDDMAGREIFG